MCLIIATTFTVAWMPLQLNLLVLAYGNRIHGLLIIQVVATLAFANSCVNPIVYALKWKPFRDSLIQVRRSLSAIMTDDRMTVEWGMVERLRREY